MLPPSAAEGVIRMAWTSMKTKTKTKSEPVPLAMPRDPNSQNK